MVYVGQDGPKKKISNYNTKKRRRYTKEHGNNMCEMSMKVMIRYR